ncbi:hypothetical protein ACJJTC_009927 [Scirpophaga incertulas]
MKKKSMLLLLLYLPLFAALAHTEATPVPQDIEELETRLMGRMVARLNAKLEGLEPRLKPKPCMRPSLAHETRAERERALPLRLQLGGLQRKTPPLQTAWSTVVKRGNRRRLERRIPTANHHVGAAPPASTHTEEGILPAQTACACNGSSRDHVAAGRPGERSYLGRGDCERQIQDQPSGVGHRGSPVSQGLNGGGQDSCHQQKQ